MNLKKLFNIDEKSVIILNLFSQIKNEIENGLQHGDWPKWYHLLNTLPEIKPSIIEFNRAIRVGIKSDLDEVRQKKLEEKLKSLMPWKKGPFSLFDIYINSEWRSDLKWDRLIKHIKPLKDKTILDVGAGNGYYMWRMLSENAKTVIGIDPYLLYVVQFLTIKSFICNAPAWLFPLKLEQFNPTDLKFNTIFSMGVLYHQRSYSKHLKKLKTLLKPGGELILETLVIEEKHGNLIIPKGRYAKMRNVCYLPSIKTLSTWLENVGYSNIKLIDVTKTTTREQRQTEWMNYESLEQFLDPYNQELTIEGYPAPIRAIFTAEIN